MSMDAQDWKDFLYENEDSTKLSGVEVRHIPKENTGGRFGQLLIWVPPSWMDYFAEELLGDGYFDDGGIEAHIVSGGYVCVDIEPLLETEGIDIKDVLKPEDYKGIVS